MSASQVTQNALRRHSRRKAGPKVVNFDLRPTVPQWRFLNHPAQFPAFVAGFGAGKTEALVGRSFLHKLMWPENDRGFYSPTYDLIRMIAFPRFEQILSELHIPYRLTKHPQNKLEIDGYGTIYFRSMEQPQRIIGYEHADADLDELDTLPKDKAREVYERVMSRNRQPKLNPRPIPGLYLQEANSIGIATTPEGFRFTYEKYEAQKEDGYEIVRASTMSNPHLPPDYVSNLENLYDPNKIAAYLRGEFVNLTSGQVYVSFDRRLCNSEETILDGEPLFIGMDFNVGQMSAVVHVLRPGMKMSEGGILVPGLIPHAVAEITKILDTPNMIETIRDRFGYRREITVFPDSSGKNRDSNNASVTDISQLEEEFSVLYPSRNPPVRDRVNSMNAAFKNGSYWVNVTACPTYAKCLEQQIYDPQGNPDKKQGLDHLPDAGGYYIHHEFGLERPVLDTSLRMVY